MNQLYSRGTKLSELPPDFRGISLAAWRKRRIDELAADPRNAKYMEQFFVKGEPKLKGQREWNKRDDYGWKSA